MWESVPYITYTGKLSILAYALLHPVFHGQFSNFQNIPLTFSKTFLLKQAQNASSSKSSIRSEQNSLRIQVLKRLFQRKH